MARASCIFARKITFTQLVLKKSTSATGGLAEDAYDRTPLLSFTEGTVAAGGSFEMLRRVMMLLLLRVFFMHVTVLVCSVDGNRLP